MKVYLIKTPEYENEKFKEVFELLRSFTGPMEFILSNYAFDKKEFYFLNYELFPHHNFIYPTNETAIKYDPNKGNPLSWRELFSLCNFYREIFSIDDNSFVVLLTKRKNALNWFSAYDTANNIFVHTADWELYTQVNSKYPIAYEVVENIMQSLMKIDITTVPNEYAHEPLRGCMNDLCNNKNEIIIKLQTANICDICLRKIREIGIEANILSQTRTIFNGIRNEFIFKNDEENQVPQPSAIIVEREGRILLTGHNLEIRLNPLFKTLYLFFLSKPDGVTLVQLSDFRAELLSIYRRLKPGASVEDAQTRIDRLSHPLGDGFNPTKTHINNTITELLGEPLADFYRIAGSAGNPYQIMLPRNLIDIRY